MKKIIALSLCFLLVVLFVGCSNSNNDEPSTTITTTATTTTTVPTTEAGIEIPNVIDVDEQSAKNVISSNSLIPRVKYEENSEIKKGNVIRTEPAVGTIVDKNSDVTIHVSSGVSGLNMSLDGYSEFYSTDCAEIKLSPDKSFKITINLLAGYGNATGTYTVSSNGAIKCTINNKDFSGFIGDEISGFTLTPIGNSKYKIDLNNVEYVGALSDNDIFG